jgi:hypothetical protein
MGCAIEIFIRRRNLEINLDSVRSKNEGHDVLQQNLGIFFSFIFCHYNSVIYIFIIFNPLWEGGRD